MPTSPAFSTALTPARRAGLTLLAAGAIVLWDIGGLDLPAARLFGRADGFPWRDTVLFEAVLHRGMRDLGWLLVGLLVAGSAWPVGFLRRLPARERIQLWVTVLAGLLLVSLMKRFSTTSCPWDLREFGGTAVHVSHWMLGRSDGGLGHCFPAGHASAGFAFIGAWFALHRRLPRLATAWWWSALAAGLLLGLSQQVRGAHFMSHTLWTGWLCWTVGGLVDLGFHRGLRAREIFANSNEKAGKEFHGTAESGARR